MGWTLMGHGENRSTVVHSWGARIHRHHAVWGTDPPLLGFSNPLPSPRFGRRRVWSWTSASDIVGRGSDLAAGGARETGGGRWVARGASGGRCPSSTALPQVSGGDSVSVRGSELAFLTQLYHKHLVVFLGYCEENDKQLLIYKYMKNGVLNVHFHDGSSMTATQLRRRLC
ncbi:hypothetical protein OsI_30739 [Oryza sativa Indica Group]|uniref:Serine-threonine/tyrosine-protein kinase catalytic domain-containing protein n=1 Tax=Oryza sativa subsp. indica TaxID=39946 RepID=A2YZG2_ORYSI|nr:hypothetical protein OsI_30739 [Oryza sativa Indica Group]